MYEQFFGLSRTPFRLEPESDMYFPGAGHVAAFSCLTNAIQDYQGIVVLSGFPGTGKTTLVRKVTEAAIVAGITICRINRANITNVEKTLEVELKNRSQLFKDGQPAELSVQQILLASVEQDKPILIVIDEAQRLSTEDIKFLVELVATNRPLMSFFKIILVGHEKLNELFDLDGLREQYQLTFVHCELMPLEQHEIKPYITYRLEKVGWNGKPNFDEAIYEFVQQATKGIPRRVNSFFDRLLLFAYLEAQEIVNFPILKKFSEELLDELQHEKSPDVDAYDLRQALNNEYTKPDVIKPRDKVTPLDKKRVDIGSKTQPLLETAAKDFAVDGSRVSNLKKWLAALVSLILVLIFVSFIFSTDSQQQALAPVDSPTAPINNVQQSVSPKMPAETVVITEQAPNEAPDARLSSEFVGPVLKVLDSPTLGIVLPEEPVFDVDEVATPSFPVENGDGLQPLPSTNLSDDINDSQVTDSQTTVTDNVELPQENEQAPTSGAESTDDDKQSAVVGQTQLTVAKVEQNSQPSVKPTNELKKNSEVVIEIGAASLDSHNIVDIDPSPTSPAKSEKNDSENTTKKETKPIKAEVNKQSKPAAEVRGETEKIKTSANQKATSSMTSQATTSPRKTNSPSVSSEIHLAKRSDPELVIIKRPIDRKSPKEIASIVTESIEDISGTGVVAPTDEDLSKLIIFFTSSYQAGEIDAFSDLFVESAVSNGSFNREQIRDDYDNLFKNTDKRRIDIEDLVWSRNGLDALGIGTFKVFISKENSNERQQFHGEIVIEAQKQQRRTQIKKLFYRYNVASNGEG